MLCVAIVTLSSYCCRYPFWRKLTTPSRWCENVHMPRNIFHCQRRRGTVATTSQNGTTSRTAEVTPSARTSTTQVERSRTSPSPAQAPPPPAEPETERDLTAVAPPSYQVYCSVKIQLIEMVAVGVLLVFNDVSIPTGCSELPNNLRGHSQASSSSSLHSHS